MDLFGGVTSSINNFSSELSKNMEIFTDDFGSITESVKQAEQAILEVEALVQQVRGVIDDFTAKVETIIDVAIVVLVVAGILFLISMFSSSVYSACAAKRKGRNPVLYFFLGLLTGSKPLDYLATLPDIEIKTENILPPTTAVLVDETPVEQNIKNSKDKDNDKSNSQKK